MRRYGDTTRGRTFSKDPAVVRFRGRYIMYYSMPPYGDGREGDGWAIGIAESQDLVRWERRGEVLPAQPPEQSGLCAPGAIVLDDRVHLFYQSYGNGPRDAICHAHSSDGHHFTRNPTNPVFSPHGDWTCGRAIDADVIARGDELLLYFATRDPEMRIQMLGVASAGLSSGFGRESWTQRCSAPILAPCLPWEQDCIEAPAVCARGGRLFMFYAGAYNNAPQQVGCAVSADGVHWARLSDQPWLENGEPGSWNASESGHPFVFVDRDGETTLFFQGNCDAGRTWYIDSVGVDWVDGLPRRGGNRSGAAACAG